MTPPESKRVSIAELVAEWRARVRRGERPDLHDYTARFPELAEQIRRLFPTVVVLEDLKAEAVELTGTATTDAVPPAAPRLERLGDFRILREVGRGGMGVVYEAEQESLGRRVALKVLPTAALLDSRQQRRFQREAKAAAKLHHTNIVPVFGVGEHDGVHYYVMQFIQGLGLDKVLAELRRLNKARSPSDTLTATAPPPDDEAEALSAADVAQSLLIGPAVAPTPEPIPASDRSPGSDPQATPLPANPSALPPGAQALTQPGWPYWRSVARIGIQVSEALEHAAAQGVLHRDVKPSNLLLDTHGNVWVTDFGLAKAAAADGEDLTHTGDIVGTLRYMAPERFDGRSDVRSDLYSLGLTLYELLVRQPAFGETDRSKLLHQVTTQEPTRPRRLNPAIPRDLETIVLKAIARDPAHRYRRPADLAADLQRFLDDRPILARRTSAAERLARWCRRNPGVAGLTAAVALLLLGVAVVSSVAALHIAAARAEADRNAANERAARAEADRARLQAQASDEESRRTLVRLHVARGAQLLNDGELFRGLAWFAEALRRDGASSPGEDLDRQRLGAVWAQCPKLLQVWAPQKAIVDADLSPDGRRVLIAGTDAPSDPAAKHFVQVFDANTGAAVGPPLEAAGRVTQAAFGPDGRHVLTVSSVPAGRRPGWEARVWDAATGELAFPPLRDTCDGYQAAFSPDGRRLLTVRREGNTGSARVWDARTGAPVTGPLQHNQRLSQAVLSPDGGRLLTVSEDSSYDPPQSHVQVRDLGTPSQTRSLQYNGGMTAARFSPDGRRVALGLAGGQLWVCDAATLNVVNTAAAHAGAISTLAFSPDGRRLLSASADGTARVWDAATGTASTPPLNHAFWVNRAAFDPAGQQVATASGDGTARVWDASTGEALTPPLAHGDNVTRAAFDPDGHRVLTVSAGQVRLWELARGLPGTGPVPPQATDARRVLFSPDGRRLLALGARQARAWDVRTGKPLGPPLDLPAGTVTHEFSPDGQRLFLNRKGPNRWETQVRDVASGRLVFPPLRHPGDLESTLYSADARRVLTESIMDQLWDADTGKPVGPPLNTWASVLALSPDGERVVLASSESSSAGVADRTPATPAPAAPVATPRSRTARVWDLVRATPVSRPFRHTDEISSASFSVDGRRVVTASHDQTARVWDTTSGEAVSPPLRHAGQVNAATFSRDGDRVVTASSDWTARVWDAASGQPVTPPLKHGGVVQHAAFSPDGRRVVTAGEDGTARVWDATAGEPLGPPLKHPGKVVRVAFTPDGRRVIVQFQVNDGTGANPPAERLWELAATDRPVEDLLRQARLLTGHLIDSTGAFVPLDTATVRQDWEALRARYPEDYAASPAEVLAWHRRRVEACQKAQDWQAVLFHLDRLLAAEPENGTLWLLRGQAQDGRGDWQRAVADYSRAIERDGDNAEAWQGRGVAHGNLGNWEAARADLTRALELAPEDGAVWLARSLAHANLGQKDKAEADFAQAAEHSRLLRVNPDQLWDDRTTRTSGSRRTWDALFGTTTRGIEARPTFAARTAGLLGSPSGQGPLLAACALYPGTDEASREPQDARVWRARGLARAAVGNWQAASEDLAHACDLGGDGQAWLALGRARMEQGEWPGARAALTRATELRPGDGGAWYLRALAHDQLHEYPQVVEACSRAIERKADGWAVRVYRGYAHGELRRDERAAADYAKAIELGAVESTLGGNEARLRAAAGDLAGCRRVSARGVALAGGSPDPETADGVARDCTLAPDAVSDWKPVLDLTDGAVAANPKDSRFVNTQGAVLYRAGRFDAAVERLGVAVELYRARGTIFDWLYLAMAHSRLGHRDEARRWLDKAVAWMGQPDDVKASEDPDLFPLTWERRLEIQVLRREAEALLKGAR